jgi:hypothetical protein
MIRSVSEALVNIRDILSQTIEKKCPKPTCWIAARNNVVVINSVIEKTTEIDEAQAEFLAELENFTGGSDIVSTLMRSSEEDRWAYDETITSLANYRNALSKARASVEARMICSVDETEVPDPF